MISKFQLMSILGACSLYSCSLNEKEAGVTNTGNTTKIYGKVTSADTTTSLARQTFASSNDTPVADIKVYLAQDTLSPEDSTKTKTDGSYSFTGMEKGLWYVQVKKNGHWVRKLVMVNENDSVEVDLKIPRTSSQIEPGNSSSVSASSSSFSYTYVAPVDTCKTIYGNSTITDCRDGKTYRTVVIGTNTWMAENLNYGIKRDTAEPEHDDGIVEKTCPGNLDTLCDKYGGLYKWTEAMRLPAACLTNLCLPTNIRIQGICPEGWVIPGESGFPTQSIESGWDLMAKNTGFAITEQATNSTGFSLLPSVTFSQPYIDEPPILIARDPILWVAHEDLETSREIYTKHQHFVVYLGSAIMDYEAYYDEGRRSSVRCMKRPVPIVSE